ncbi:MAG: dicarboxylate/amino acid:cation symporter [Prevotellaceae bacterium]|jgi:Na+/H+-dicarboxylate symporter|nr:dicarboxylate/amino acid:cation symporter [Prevotellaceae bacterium]
MNLTKYILLALVAGVIVGIVATFIPEAYFSPVNEWVLVPLGKIFINLIKMLVVPIVFCSITMGVFQLGDPRKVGKMGGRTLLFFLCTTAIAICVAMVLALLIQPGHVPGLEPLAAAPSFEETPSMMDNLLGIIPDNPVASMAQGNMLQIIFFAVLFGIGISLLGNKSQTVKNFITETNDVLMKIINIVMYTAPFGAFALITSAIGSNGAETLRQMGMYVLVVLLALGVHFFFTYGTTLRVWGKMSLIDFVKKFYPAMVVGFSTSSSNATLPISMEVAQEKLKVPAPISSFVQSLGSTINMDGTAIMQGVATVFVAQVYGIDLTMGQIIMVIITAVLASIGTAGVPAVGLVMLVMVFNQVGLPVEGIGLIIGIDRILDMVRTSVNITGDAICAVIMTRVEERSDAKLAKKSQ